MEPESSEELMAAELEQLRGLIAEQRALRDRFQELAGRLLPARPDAPRALTSARIGRILNHALSLALRDLEDLAAEAAEGVAP